MSQPADSSDVTASLRPAMDLRQAMDQLLASARATTEPIPFLEAETRAWQSADSVLTAPVRLGEAPADPQERKQLRTAIASKSIEILGNRFRLVAPDATVGQPVSLGETQDNYFLRVAMPSSLRPDQISVMLRGNVAMIRGTAGIEDLSGPNLGATLRGEFQQDVQLPGDFDADQVIATYENGILTLTLPKSESAPAQRIQVTQGADQSPSKEEQGQAFQEQGQE